MNTQIKGFPKKKILLAQAGSPSVVSSYDKLGQEFGLQVDFMPFTVKKPISVPSFRKYKQKILKHTALIFTNSLAIDYFFKLAKASNIQMPETTKYFFPNVALGYYLQKHIHLRKRKVFTGERGFQDLAPYFKRFKTEAYLFPCSNIKRLDIRQFFKEKKYVYSELPIYEILENKLNDNLISDYDLIVFFSPLDVSVFKKRFPDFMPGEIQIATFGRGAEKAVRNLGWKPFIKAPQDNVPSMRSALEQYFRTFA